LGAKLRILAIAPEVKFATLFYAVRYLCFEEFGFPTTASLWRYCIIPWYYYIIPKTLSLLSRFSPISITFGK
jgi:hypothetical protein